MKNASAIKTLVAANLISGIAQGLSMISVPWHFANMGMGSAFAWLHAIVTFALIFWSPYSGVLTDKYDRRWLFVTLNIICGCILSAIALWGWLSGTLSWIPLAMVFTTTFFNYSLHYTVLYALMQEITEPQDFGRLNSILEIQNQVGTTVAGGVAALVIEGHQIFGIQVPQVPLWIIFGLDGSTYLVSAFLLSRLKYVSLVIRTPEEGNPWQRLKLGWEYLRSTPYLFVFGLASFSVFVTLIVHFYNLSGPYVKLLGGDAMHYAASDMCYAAGAMLSGAVIQRLFAKWEVNKAIVLLMVLAITLLIVFIFNTNLWLYVGLMFGYGLANAGVRVLRMTYLFKTVPNQVSGRVHGIFGLLNIAMRAAFLALFSLSFFHHGSQLLWSFAIMALFLGLSAGVLVFYNEKIRSL